MQISLFTFTPTLMIAGCAIGRSRKVRVAKSAPAPSRCQPLGTIMCEIAEQFSAFGFKDLRSNWNTDDMVYTAVARAIRAFSMQSTISDVARVIAEMQHGIEG